MTERQTGCCRRQLKVGMWGVVLRSLILLKTENSFFFLLQNDDRALCTVTRHCIIVEISPSTLLNPAINFSNLFELTDRTVGSGWCGEESYSWSFLMREVYVHHFEVDLNS